MRRARKSDCDETSCTTDSSTTCTADLDSDCCPPIRRKKKDPCERGPRGPRGPRGCEGPKGPMGCIQKVRGPRGPPGKAGCPGRRGPVGRDGSRGPAGNDGRRGADGRQGDRGPRGQTGSPGGDFPFDFAYEVVVWDAGGAWEKASEEKAALGSVDHSITMVLHQSQAIFQNMRINSKAPDSLIVISLVFYAPFDQLANARVEYDAGTGDDIKGIIQTVSVNNTDQTGSFHLQDNARGAGTLYLAYNIAS